MGSDTEVLLPNNVGVIGATSLVGECLLTVLAQSDWRVLACSRREINRKSDGIEWKLLPLLESISEPPLPFWICLAPIWTLHEHFALLEAQGAKRVVALSSTSLFTKGDSSDPAEQDVANKLSDGEAQFRAWAEDRGIEWVVIRPTLIYGLGRDKNISEMVRFIRRWSFFPLLGSANGLRQPVHAVDVAKACHAAIISQSAMNQAYNLSGGEILSYKEMVSRVFLALDKKPRFVSLPSWLLKFGVRILRMLPRFRHWSIGMVDRMDRDMVFDHNEADVALGVSPRTFNLEARDLPECCQF